MSEKRINLNVVDLQRLNKWIVENPEVQYFEIIVPDESGIGSTIEVEYTHVTKGYPTKTRVEISGVENW
jgi:hypothetical protein